MYEFVPIETKTKIETLDHNVNFFVLSMQLMAKLYTSINLNNIWIQDISQNVTVLTFACLTSSLLPTKV